MSGLQTPDFVEFVHTKITYRLYAHAVDEEHQNTRPLFSGFRGQRYSPKLARGRIYNLLSASDLQVNGRIAIDSPRINAVGITLVPSARRTAAPFRPQTCPDAATIRIEAGNDSEGVRVWLNGHEQIPSTEMVSPFGPKRYRRSQLYCALNPSLPNDGQTNSAMDDCISFRSPQEASRIEASGLPICEALHSSSAEVFGPPSALFPLIDFPSGAFLSIYTSSFRVTVFKIDSSLDMQVELINLRSIVEFDVSTRHKEAMGIQGLLASSIRSHPAVATSNEHRVSSLFSVNSLFHAGHG
jgi:hypothetical protein